MRGPSDPRRPLAARARARRGIGRRRARDMPPHPAAACRGVRPLPAEGEGKTRQTETRPAATDSPGSARRDSVPISNRRFHRGARREEGRGSNFIPTPPLFSAPSAVKSSPSTPIRLLTCPGWSSAPPPAPPGPRRGGRWGRGRGSRRRSRARLCGRTPRCRGRRRARRRCRPSGVRSADAFRAGAALLDAHLDRALADAVDIQRLERDRSGRIFSFR